MSIDQVSDSPYARVAAKLIDSGYSAVPCMPGAKIPGRWDGKTWSGMGDWTRFCDRLPTDIETNAWSKFPDAGVCIVLGFNGVVAVDIDTDQHEIVEAIFDALPCESPVQKRGKKGATHFFRAGPVVVSQPFNVGSERVLDLLCKAKQTVVPGTIHPGTGKPYIWLTCDTLEHVSADRLPMLPDDIAERFARALGPFGYEPEVERAHGARATSGNGHRTTSRPRRSRTLTHGSRISASAPSAAAHRGAATRDATATASP